MTHTLTQIVKGNIANLSHIRGGVAYYSIKVEDSLYQLDIDVTTEEWKTTDLYPTYGAITLMRWIRKAIELDNGSFNQIG